MSHVKLLIPSVPKAEALLPYLKRIDTARWYTNFGQLVCELEERLRARFPGAYVVTTSSCTSGLELAFRLYKTMGLEHVALSPLTFQATALAAAHAGLRVEFRDPDPETWTDGTVAAFGLPAYSGPVVDAAAAIGEQTVPPDLVAVFSLHATKPLPAGEGGFIVTHDQGEAEELRGMTNFGFLAATRTSKYRLGHAVSRSDGTNAKLSEYHAAVALAALDGWESTRREYLNLHDVYEEFLPANVRRQKRGRGVWPVLAVELPCSVTPVMKLMEHDGIETRRWYTPPLYKHPMFYGDAAKFPVCERLTSRLIGLPYHLWLSRGDIQRVCESLTTAIDKTVQRERE